MKIAFLGDSITYGYGLEDKSLRYATLVAKDLNATEENYGITGTLMAKAGPNREGEKESGRDFLVRLPNIDAADAAVIFGGTNDYFWSDRPIEGGDTEDYFARAVELILSHVCEKRRGKVTLIVTPYPHNGIGNYLGGEKFNDSNRHDTDAVNYNGHVLSDYVETLKTLCARYGMPCLDLHADFGFDWRVHTMDGCHPNEEGHRVLADRIAAELKKLLANG